MSNLLLESPRFCQFNRYICLAEQIDKTYEMVKEADADHVTSVLSGNVAVATTDDEPTNPQVLSGDLLDLLNHPQVC